MKYYLIKVDEPKRTVKKGKLVWIKTTCNEVVEFTEKELQHIADLDTFMYEDEEDSYYDDFLDEIQDKIRKVLDNE